MLFLLVTQIGGDAPAFAGPIEGIVKLAWDSVDPVMESTRSLELQALMYLGPGSLERLQQEMDPVDLGRFFGDVKRAGLLIWHFENV